jgi:hypothetical protein
MNSVFDWTPYQDEILHGLPPEFAGHMSGTAQPSVFRVVHDEPSRPAARDRRSQSSTLDRPHTLDRTWPSCIIAPPLGKGRGGVPFRRNCAEIALHCAILPRP